MDGAVTGGNVRMKHLKVPAKTMRESLSKEQRSLMQALSKGGVSIVEINYKGKLWKQNNK